MNYCWQFVFSVLQIALAATAIAVTRTRVMVDLYIGYFCAFELADKPMCTPTIAVSATSLALSGLVLLLIAFASRESGEPLAALFQLAGGLMWFGFGIAAAVGVSESDNPLDDYVEALSGARGVVAICFFAGAAMFGGLCAAAAGEDGKASQ